MQKTNRSSPVSWRGCVWAARFAGLMLAALAPAVGDAGRRAELRGPALAPATQPADPASAFASGILGSKHDFSDGGRVPRDLCMACHTPHLTAAQAPLLVRRPGATTQPTRSYQTAAGRLDAASLVCLSCHDGSVAPGVYAGSHATTWFEHSTVGASRGRPRMTSHPIGVPLPTGDPTCHSPAAAVQSGAVRLYDGLLQCTSCHDPHNTARHPGMLWISNDRSRQCLSCHRL